MYKEALEVLNLTYALEKKIREKQIPSIHQKFCYGFYLVFQLQGLFKKYSVFFQPHLFFLDLKKKKQIIKVEYKTDTLPTNISII